MTAVGSYVELQAIVAQDTFDSEPEGTPANSQLELAAITEPFSGKRLCLCELPTSEPEVRAANYPPPGAVTLPLAPTSCGMPAHERDKRARAPIPARATNAVEQAYDRLHRTQVMLAFVKTPNWENPKYSSIYMKRSVPMCKRSAAIKPVTLKARANAQPRHATFPA